MSTNEEHRTNALVHLQAALATYQHSPGETDLERARAQTAAIEMITNAALLGALAQPDDGAASIAERAARMLAQASRMADLATSRSHERAAKSGDGFAVEVGGGERNLQ